MNNSDEYHLFHISKINAEKSQNVTQFLLKSIISFIGVAFISLGATFLKEGNVGLDPFTSVALGLTHYFPGGLGIVELSFNAILFVIVLCLDRRTIGIGTVFNVVLAGFYIQGFSKVYRSVITVHIQNQLHWPIIIMDALLGVLIFALGVSLYMKTHLGVAPYDAIAPIIIEHTNWKYPYVRSAQDITFMICGFLLHSNVGIMTIVVAFFTGPLVKFWTVHVSEGLVNHINSFSLSQTRAKNIRIGAINAWKVSLHQIQQAYMDTNEIQHTISSYTDAELDDLLNITQSKLQENRMHHRLIANRYEMIQTEIRRRQARLTYVKPQNKSNDKTKK